MTYYCFCCRSLTSFVDHEDDNDQASSLWDLQKFVLFVIFATSFTLF